MLLNQCPIPPPKPNSLHHGTTEGCLSNSSSSSRQCLSSLRASYRHAVQSWSLGAAPFNPHGSVQGPAHLPLGTLPRAQQSLLSPLAQHLDQYQTKPFTSLWPVQHLPAQLALGTGLHSALGASCMTDRLQALPHLRDETHGHSISKDRMDTEKQRWRLNSQMAFPP